MRLTSSFVPRHTYTSHSVVPTCICQGAYIRYPSPEMQLPCLIYCIFKYWINSVIRYLILGSIDRSDHRREGAYWVWLSWPTPITFGPFSAVFTNLTHRIHELMEEDRLIDWLIHNPYGAQGYDADLQAELFFVTRLS